MMIDENSKITTYETSFPFQDLLKKNGYSYKGRIDLDDSEILDVEDGKGKNYLGMNEDPLDFSNSSKLVNSTVVL